MASKRVLRRRQCGHKHRHATQREARAHVVALEYAGGHDLQPYRCPWCKQFHVGHARSRHD